MADHETSAFDADFDAFRAALLPQVTPAGPAAVRTTVRRRRRIAVTTAAAVAVALIVGPVAGYAALNRGPAPPPPASVTSPTPTESPSPSVSPSTSPTQSASGTPAAPDGRISRATLLKAKLNLPGWQANAPAWCTTNGVRLRDMANARAQNAPTLMTTVYADADGDGAQETVAILGCQLGEADAQQVVVFDRGDHGQIVVLGQVTRIGNDFDWITDLRPGSPGSVQVEVGDIQPCCDTPQYWARKQWRTYSWTGHGFTQSGGPTTFGPDTRLTDLKLTAGKLVLGAPNSTGDQHGSLTVTVTNAGPLDVQQVGFLYLETIGAADGGDWSKCQRTPSKPTSTWPSCMMTGLRVGEQRTYTFDFLVTPTTPDASGRISWSGVRVDPYDAQNRLWPDLTMRDNAVDVPIPIKK